MTSLLLTPNMLHDPAVAFVPRRVRGAHVLIVLKEVDPESISPWRLCMGAYPRRDNLTMVKDEYFRAVWIAVH